MKKVQLTQHGYENLQKELEELKQKKRPYAIERLGKARAMGDLSENSEYTAAKDELAFMEGRIQEVEEMLKNVEVVNNHVHKNMVDLGSYVTVEVDGTKEELQIVGEFEADPMNKKLSSISPIGKALLNHHIGEELEVEIPDGKTKYKILAIK